MNGNEVYYSINSRLGRRVLERANHDPQALDGSQDGAEGSRCRCPCHGVVRLPSPDPEEASTGSRADRHLLEDGKGTRAASWQPFRVGGGRASGGPEEAVRESLAP